MAGLPGETITNGGALAIVNHEPTPYDDEAALVVHDAAAVTLGAVASLLA